jgi:hypothetical protein
MSTDPYPRWEYFPRNVRPPEWVEPFVAEVRAIELRISTVEQRTGMHSDDVLQDNRGQLASVPVFARGLDLLSALYASQRLPLPLRGVLLVGY